MKKTHILLATLLMIAVFLQVPAYSESTWGTGRISIFTQGSNYQSGGGDTTSYQEISSYFSLWSPTSKETGMEYGVDLRTAAYPGMEDRTTRFSLYSAYVGHRSSLLSVRVGQTWINELGALGSVGGLMAYTSRETGFGKIRFGGFGGKEPEILKAAYVPGVVKWGGYFAIDSGKGRSSSVGYVNISNSGLTERSVLVFTNYFPAGNKLFLYQAAELDLTGPGGTGNGGLNYFFLNARGNPSESVEIQGTFHHGRSIDTRSITLDEINGRPVNPAQLNGFLYESAEGRVTVRVVSNLRVFAGYGRDVSDRESGALGRLQYGFFTPDVLGTGIDLRLAGYRYTPPDGPSYGSISFSAGKMLGSRVYLSGEYTNALAVLSASEVDGVVVTHQPRSSRFSLYSLVTLTRAFSLQFTIDRTQGELDSETRFLAGFNYRI